MSQRRLSGVAEFIAQLADDIGVHFDEGDGDVESDVPEVAESGHGDLETDMKISRNKNETHQNKFDGDDDVTEDPTKSDDSREDNNSRKHFPRNVVSNVFAGFHSPEFLKIYRQRVGLGCRTVSHVGIKRSQNRSCDIISLSIMHGMWFIVDKIFSYVDATTLSHCERVCGLWHDYIRQQNIWRKVVEKSARAAPNLIRQNGWSKYLTATKADQQLQPQPQDPDGDNDGEVDIVVDDLEVEEETTADEVTSTEKYKELYWKMTNLAELWRSPAKGPTELKNHFQRTGPIVWKFLASSQRAISVYNCGKGFVLKIHDQQTYRFRGAHKETYGTMKKDTLCLDATDDRIVVGGMVSQKVWVFKVDEFELKTTGSLLNVLVTSMASRGGRNGLTALVIDIHKYINAEAGVKKVQFHPRDTSRVAVLLPLNQLVEIWNVEERTRLQSFVVTSDSCYLLWKQPSLLLTAPLFSGILMPFDPETGRELTPMVGNIRRIDCIDVYENLCATGESQLIRLWSLVDGRSLVSWNAAKTFISAILLNDTMVVSGSSAGSVKLWDLKTLLGRHVKTIAPLRKISMKGVLHYPIKDIFQFTYTDLVIVAKYEANRRKDKIKLVKVFSGRNSMLV